MTGRGILTVAHPKVRATMAIAGDLETDEPVPAAVLAFDGDTRRTDPPTL